MDDRNYQGPERRRDARRSRAERRDMVRFQPDQAPRRGDRDRRGLQNPWLHRDL